MLMHILTILFGVLDLIAAVSLLVALFIIVGALIIEEGINKRK